jgi:fluoroquinolone transport system permease protein
VSTWPVVRTDLTLQLRYGIYAAYAFVAVAYVVLLRSLATEPRLVALPPVLLSEASVIGFFFAGTLLHLERSDGVLSALAVTPLRTSRYLVSKMASLALLSALVALLIAWAALGALVHPPLLAAAAALTTALFVAGGLAAAAWFRSLDAFIIWGGLGSAFFALPVLPYLGVLESPLWWLLPTHPALVLLDRAAGPAARTGTGAPGAVAPGAVPGDMVSLLALIVLAAWTALAFSLARRWVARHAFGRLGGDA